MTSTQGRNTETRGRIDKKNFQEPNPKCQIICSLINDHNPISSLVVTTLELGEIPVRA